MKEPEGFREYIEDKYRMNLTAFKTLHENTYANDLDAYRAGMLKAAEISGELHLDWNERHCTNSDAEKAILKAAGVYDE